ncbi:hypothetical protein D3C80_1531520 [compost metagenome]
MAVAAVGGSQQVARMQVGADAGGHGLLAGGQVQRALDERRLGVGGGALAPDLHAALAGAFGRVFESADADHGPVQGKQIGHVVSGSPGWRMVGGTSARKACPWQAGSAAGPLCGQDAGLGPGNVT